MLNKLILCVCFINVVFNCSVMRGFLFPTLPEEVFYAGIVVKGKVKSVENKMGDAGVVLEGLSYFRGCNGKDEIRIKGFRNSAACGKGVPQVGEEIIVFACDTNQKGYDYQTNFFTVFTGFARLKLLAKVKTLTNVQEAVDYTDCGNVNVKSRKCYDRKTDYGLKW